jgi:glycosyltransferase involved in cell wall biosynthesis
VISLAYITRNEAKYIERSIQSARAVADEIVVLDAQSDDGTPDICVRLGAKVISEPWRDDFSYARNKLKEACTQPWIFTLDGDEHVEGEKLEVVKRAAVVAQEDEIVAYQFPRKHHYPSHDPQSPFFGPPFYPDFQTRLFRNVPGIFYSGKVHEGVVQSIQVGNVGGIGRVPVCIHHHMFRGDQARYEVSKASYYEKLGG